MSAAIRLDTHYVAIEDQDLAKTALGAIVFWQLKGDVRLEALDEALTKNNSEAIRPEPPSDVVALRRAVESTAKHYGLESHGKKDGTWRLVAPGAQETESSLENNPFVPNPPKKKLTYDVKLTAALVRKEGIAQKDLEIESFLPETNAPEMLRRFVTSAKAVLPPEDISQWLCERLAALNAVPLRQSGGFYFLPAASLERWEGVRKALQSCSSHQIHQIASMRTKDAFDAVFSAISGEIEQGLALIGKDIQEGVGQRALESRQNLTAALLEKVEKYEGILGSRLEQLRSGIDQTRAAVATAIMLANSESKES